MGIKKIQAKQIKDEILSCDCNYDYIYHELEINFENAMSGVLKAML